MNINIVCVTDNNYAQHLGVMLCSIFEHQKCDNELNIYVIDGGISEKNKSRLEDIGKRHNATITFLEIDKTIYKNFKISYHINHTVYYRISIPEILDSSIKKVIYLDCDLIIKEDISKLWYTDISEYFIAAVENPKFNRHVNLKIPVNSKYFNTGVMLINLEKWRQYNISIQVIEFIKNNLEKIVLWDQDGLNAILYNKWKELHPKWNQQTIMFELAASKTFRNEEFYETIKNPSIIHYTTSSKPWHYMNEHPLKSEYYKYIRKTPWKKYSPPDKNISNISKKIIKKILPNSMVNLIRNIKYIIFRK